jgi:hypothetical protein
MANWRDGIGRLGLVLAIAWTIGWIVFFIYLVAEEPAKPLDYLTFACIVFVPPAALLLIGWVWRAFRTKS